MNKNKLPKTFSLVKFAPNTINADIGGGKFDNVTEFLSEKGVENKIFDPFNRSKEHNQKIVKQIRGGQSDTATVNNVLNVIKEQKNREIQNIIKRSYIYLISLAVIVVGLLVIIAGIALNILPATVF